MNKKLCYSLLVTTFISLLHVSALQAEPAVKKDKAKGDGETLVLFDGKTLKGWEGNEKMFRVEDGAIVAGTMKEPIPHNDFLCTKREFENFELRAMVKLVPASANAGIQFRSERIPDHFEVSGYQADMGAKWWGKLYDESRRKKILVDTDLEKLSKDIKVEDWNEYVIRCEGHHIQLFLNGVQTVDYTEPDKSLATKGIIGLQIHSGPPAEAYYKDITIKILK